MQPLSGPGAPITGDRTTVDVRPATLSSGPGDQPLSPAQRTTLEKLIIKIVSLSSLKAAELWAGVHHEVGVKNDAGLLSRHFSVAEQFLTERLAQVQTTHATRQLFQQLTDLLAQGNNRQAVSDFIRQQFGHTVLSTLTPDQLRQVLTMLQNSQMTIPQPQQNHITDRTLLPAEYHTLNQQMAKLAAATGEHPVKLWAAVLKMVNLHSGDPIPSRVFPLLTQYLQASQMLNQHSAPTLSHLLSALKVPPDHAEQKMLEDASQQRFQLPPQAVLTPAQAQDLINLFFARRAERLHEQPVSASEMDPQPIVSPLWAWVPPNLQPLFYRPAVTVFAAVLLVFLMWFFL